MACGQTSSLATLGLLGFACAPTSTTFCPCHGAARAGRKRCLRTTVSQGQGKLTGIFGQQKYSPPWNRLVLHMDVQSPITSAPASAAARSRAGLSLAGIPLCCVWRSAFSHSRGLCHQVIRHQRGLWVLFLDVGVSWDFWESQQRHCCLCLLQGGDFYIYFIQMHTVTLETGILFGLFSTWWDCSTCWLTVECLD